jgi:O-antigen ligase
MLRKIQLTNIQPERILVFLCIFFLPLKPIFSNASLILLILISAVQYHKNFGKLKSQKILIPFVIFFLIYLSGLLFTPDLNSELRVVERKITFLLVPITVALFPYEKIIQLKKGFWEGIFYLALVLGLYSFFSSYILYNELGYLPTVGERVNQITYMHRPYFGLIQALSFAYVLSLLYEHKSKIHPVYIVGAVVSLVSINLVVARLSTAVVIIITLYFTYAYLNKQKKLSSKTFIGTIIALIISVSAISQNDRFSDRFHFMLQGKGEPRILIWRCAYEQFMAPGFNYFFGNGSSSRTFEQLIACYKSEYESKTYWSWVYEFRNNYNTHNEFFDVLLSHGILGLLSLILLFSMIYLRAKHEKDLAGKLFVITFILGCLTENLLDRHSAIFIFTIGASIITFSRLQSGLPIAQNETKL